MPGQTASPEAIGLDLWANAEGMGEYYASLSGYEAAFTSEPETSVCEQASGGMWTEW